MPASSRDLRLDFFRGLALIFIFIDHIPENILSYFTIGAVEFFDAAEIFIFISGYTAALVYGQTLVSQGTLYATARVLGRAWQLYVAHIFLFVMFIAEVSYTVTTFNNPMYNDEMRVGDFLDEPHVAIVKALLLEFQPTFLDILPLYILLLVVFPVVLLGLRLRPLIVLLPSFMLYLIVQATNLSVPAYPEGHVWYFNPLAWQFVFIAGAALGFPWRHERLMVEVGSAGIADSSGRCCGRIGRQVQLDDPRYLGPVPRTPSQGVVAGEQEQLVPDPGDPLLRCSRGRCHHRTR